MLLIEEEFRLSLPLGNEQGSNPFDKINFSLMVKQPQESSFISKAVFKMFLQTHCMKGLLDLLFNFITDFQSLLCI